MSEIKGILTDVRPTENVTSKAGKEYAKRYFKLEYPDGQYTGSCWFELFGDKTILIDDVRINETITVEFTPVSREWQDKIFTENKAWKITRHNPAPVTAPAPVFVPPATYYKPGEVLPANPDDKDDLPF
jgi:hypothetical protein